MISYLRWHYITGLTKLLILWRNLTVFPLYYFGVFGHLTTFFVPWRRQTKRHKPGFILDSVVSVIFYNLTALSIGMLLRILAVTAGVFTLPFFFTTGLILTVIWIFMPLVTWPFYLSKRLRNESTPTKILEKNPGNLQKLALKILTSEHGRFSVYRVGLSTKAIEEAVSKNSDTGDFSSLTRYLKNHQRDRPDAAIVEAVFATYVPLLLELRANDSTTEDVYGAAAWYENAKTQTVTPLLWNLSRIKGLYSLGAEWSYGYTTRFGAYAKDVTHLPTVYPILLGHDKEIAKIEEILVKSSGNNVLIVGEPGTAKHLLVQTLARRMRNGECLSSLAHKRILEVDMQALIASRPSRAELKGFAKEILAEASAAGNIIVYIDEIDRYLSDAEGRVDLSDVLESFAKSNVGLIGITTTAHFHTFIQPQATLEELFEKFELSALPRETLISELELAIVPVLERKHKVCITYQALSKTIENCDRYISQTSYPGKAIELLDQAVVSLVSQKKGKVLTGAHIDETISQKLKIPVGNLAAHEREILANLEDRLHQRVINQNEALHAISASLRRSRLCVSANNKPIGSFLFLGPTGVGKTETAKALAQLYFGSQGALLRFDMSQYRGEEGVTRLIGSTTRELAGELTSKLRDTPFAVLLLDEFEKTDNTIANLFLPLFDEGYITDGKGEAVDAKNTLVIATSNAGANFIREKITLGSSMGESDKELSDALISHIMNENIFSPELLNRFDKIIAFSPLSEGNLKEVAKLMLNSLNKRLAPKEVSVAITDTLVKNLASEGFDPVFGARSMKRVIAEKIEDEVAKRLLSGTVAKGEQIVIE